jgi:hypothetical protein
MAKALEKAADGPNGSTGHIEWRWAG